LVNADAIEAEVTTARAAELVNADAIEAEVTTARAAELVNADAIEAEVTTARAAELANADAIEAETTTARAAELANADAIEAEVTRTRAAELANADAIEVEVTTARAAELANADAIEAEVTTARAAELVNADAIEAEVTTARAAELANADAIEAEITTARAAELVNADAIEAAANEVDILIANLRSQIDNLNTFGVGSVTHDGVVFYVFQSGDTGYISGEIHGLVCAYVDRAFIQFATGDCLRDLPSVPNVASTGASPTGPGAELGDGASNTNKILSDCAFGSVAASDAQAQDSGSDWFLPSINELNEMFVNKEILESVAGFSAFSDFYWSSTESDADNAWKQNFSNGIQDDDFKGFEFFVRAVRAF